MGSLSCRSLLTLCSWGLRVRLVALSGRPAQGKGLRIPNALNPTPVTPGPNPNQNPSPEARSRYQHLKMPTPGFPVARLTNLNLKPQVEPPHTGALHLSRLGGSALPAPAGLGFTIYSVGLRLKDQVQVSGVFMFGMSTSSGYTIFFWGGSLL